jgi:hypothetical protein
MTEDFEVLAELGGAAAIEMVASALVDHGAHAAKCSNCSAPVIAAYCSVCGQERNTHRRSVRILVGEFFREIVSFDSRILRTATALVVRPGELSLAFQEGRPRRYVPALRLYLFVSLIFFLTLSATGIAIVQLEFIVKPEKYVTNAKGQTFAIVQGSAERVPVPADKAKEPGPHYSISSNLHMFAREGAYHNNLPAEARAKLEQDRLRAEQKSSRSGTGAWIVSRVFRSVEALESDPAAINRPLTEWIPRVLFFLLPLFALLLAAYYWRQRKQFYFVDHLVFSLNMHSFVFVAILIAVGAARLISGGIAAWLAIAAVALYLLLSMKRFYKQNWFWTAIKFLSVSFVYTVFFLFPTVLLVITVSILGI